MGLGLPPLNGVDAACMAHDIAYAKAGLNSRNGVPIIGSWGLSPQQEQAKAAADQQLCDSLKKTIWYTSQQAADQFYVGAAFGCIP